MSDDRTELKTPNLLSPEQVRPVEVEHGEVQETVAPAQTIEHAEETPSTELPSNVVQLPKREAVAVAAPRVERDPATKTIDGILEANIGKFVDTLSKEDQAAFIAEGEKLTAELVGIVQEKKPNFSHTLDHITKWLHMLPMLNKEYLRQEAKRKNDQVEMYVEAQKQRNQLAA